MQHLQSKESRLHHSFEIYMVALKSAINCLPLPQAKDFQLLLERICDGFAERQKEGEKVVARLHEKYGITIR